MENFEISSDDAEEEKERTIRQKKGGKSKPNTQTGHFRGGPTSGHYVQSETDLSYIGKFKHDEQNKSFVNQSMMVGGVTHAEAVKNRHFANTLAKDSDFRIVQGATILIEDQFEIGTPGLPSTKNELVLKTGNDTWDYFQMVLNEKEEFFRDRSITDR